MKDVDVELIPGSLYQLKGASRYAFTHSILSETVTERRISLTFRTLAKEKVPLPDRTLQSLSI